MTLFSQFLDDKSRNWQNFHHNNFIFVHVTKTILEVGTLQMNSILIDICNCGNHNWMFCHFFEEWYETKINTKENEAIKPISSLISAKHAKHSTFPITKKADRKTRSQKKRHSIELYIEDNRNYRFSRNQQMPALKSGKNYKTITWKRWMNAKETRIGYEIMT